MPFSGILLAESIRTDAVLDGRPVVVRRIWRRDAGDASAGQPVTWTFIEFEVPDAGVGRLAEALSAVLSPDRWYCDLRSEDETIVVFAGRVFRYARGEPSWTGGRRGARAVRRCPRVADRLGRLAQTRVGAGTRRRG
jgi:hypothetical protein